MNQMDPAITPLVPVLQSYWLTIHVAVIMGGYGFLAIGFLLGLTGLSLMALPHSSSTLKKKLNEMATINEISLLLGLSLMTAGTFLGAIWANEAWGRYWGWDPKETWALITILVYTAITHARFIPKFNNEFVLFASSVWGFSSVLMTYLGVNYYLTGMHSYGSGNAPLKSIFSPSSIWQSLFSACWLSGNSPPIPIHFKDIIQTLMSLGASQYTDSRTFVTDTLEIQQEEGVSKLSNGI